MCRVAGFVAVSGMVVWYGGSGRVAVFGFSGRLSDLPVLMRSGTSLPEADIGFVIVLLDGQGSIPDRMAGRGVSVAPTQAAESPSCLSVVQRVVLGHVCGSADFLARPPNGRAEEGCSAA